MIPLERIEKAKQVSIVGYLLSMGIKPVKIVGVQYLYYSPFKDEHTPSFYVHPDKNVFKDFTTTEKGGDIIDLVKRLQGCSFHQAIKTLESFNGSNDSFSFSGQNPSTSPNNTITVKKVKALENKALIQYLSQSRGIPLEIAGKYLKECYFQYNNKDQFAVAFENDSGGLELRNRYTKLSTTPKGISTIKGQHNQTALIFEGFTDFLSYVVLYGVPACDTIVLNSVTANIDKALPILKQYQSVMAYVDNDQAGSNALEYLKQAGLRVSDCRGVFKPYKDLNEHLINKKKT